jgi:hypothetical protein
VVEGWLPEGVELNGAGYFEGVPRREGVYPLVVEARNGCDVVRRALKLEVTGAPLFTLIPNEMTLRWRKGDPYPTASLKVSATWPELAYAIDVEGATWLDARPLNGRTPYAGAALASDPVELVIDPSRLAPGTHRAVLRISAWQSANRPRVDVTLVVE